MIKVLVACEFSGVVREAFNAYHGVHAISCDLLPPEDGRVDYHYQGDVFDIINDGWDIMIAHPPCTYLSKAGARWLYAGGKLNKERYELGLMAKEFFLKLLSSNIPRIVIENPTPLKVYELPKHTQIIQPFEYGHPFSKRTLLWIKNLCLLTPTNVVEKYNPFCPSNTGGKKENNHIVLELYTMLKMQVEHLQELLRLWRHSGFLMS